MSVLWGLPVLLDGSARIAPTPVPTTPPVTIINNPPGSVSTSAWTVVAALAAAAASVVALIVGLLNRRTGKETSANAIAANANSKLAADAAGQGAVAAQTSALAAARSAQAATDAVEVNKQSAAAAEVSARAAARSADAARVSAGAARMSDNLRPIVSRLGDGRVTDPSSAQIEAAQWLVDDAKENGVSIDPHIEHVAAYRPPRSESFDKTSDGEQLADSHRQSVEVGTVVTVLPADGESNRVSALVVRRSVDGALVDAGAARAKAALRTSPGKSESTRSFANITDGDVVIYSKHSAAVRTGEEYIVLSARDAVKRIDR